MKRLRATIKKPITITGIGIHTGEETTLRLYPATADTGIVFRKPGTKRKIIEASPMNVTDTNGSVTMSAIGHAYEHHVKTIEHLMCALRVAKISDIIIENDNEEVPILDGSALPYYKELMKAGIKRYKETIDYIYIKKPITIIGDNDQYVSAFPGKKLSVLYTIDFDHPSLKNRTVGITFDRRQLVRDLLPARTFGFLKDAVKLLENDMAKGVSRSNSIILSENNYINKPRLPDECVRHKILDFLGDTYTIGRPIIGHFVVNKGNHKMHIALAQSIYKQYIEKSDTK